MPLPILLTSSSNQPPFRLPFPFPRQVLPYVSTLAIRLILSRSHRQWDAGLYEAITDCGAGGLSSAVGEMGQNLGAEVDLEKVPLKYAGLNYTEIWISEAQERMVIAVKDENLDEIMEISPVKMSRRR